MPPTKTVKPFEKAIPFKNNPSGASAAIAPILVPDTSVPSYTVIAPPLVFKETP